MAKLTKQYYYSAKGDKKVNCYKVTLSKAIVSLADIGEDDDIEITTNGREIIIRKA